MKLLFIIVLALTSFIKGSLQRSVSKHSEIKELIKSDQCTATLNHVSIEDKMTLMSDGNISRTCCGCNPGHYVEEFCKTADSLQSSPINRKYDQISSIRQIRHPDFSMKIKLLLHHNEELPVTHVPKSTLARTDVLLAKEHVDAVSDSGEVSISLPVYVLSLITATLLVMFLTLLIILCCCPTLPIVQVYQCCCQPQPPITEESQQENRFPEQSSARSCTNTGSNNAILLLDRAPDESNDVVAGSGIMKELMFDLRSEITPVDINSLIRHFFETGPSEQLIHECNTKDNIKERFSHAFNKLDVALGRDRFNPPLISDCFKKLNMNLLAEIMEPRMLSWNEQMQTIELNND